MATRHRNRIEPLRDQRGFTLPEVLTTIAILGILLAIAIGMWNSVIESRRVDSAANQLASDMRLAHTRATNQLTDWRVIFMADGSPVTGCGSGTPDYCLVELQAPYPNSSPVIEDTVGRALPDGTKIKEFTFDKDCAGGAGEAIEAPSDCGATRTLEFSSDGSVRTLRPGQSGTVTVSSDDDHPTRNVSFLSATSRIKLD